MKRDTIPAAERLTRIAKPETSEIVYDHDEVEFLKAMDQFKRQYRKPFPTCREVLMVLRSLGYRKIMPPESIEEVLRTHEEG